MKNKGNNNFVQLFNTSGLNFPFLGKQCKFHAQ